MAPIIIIGSGFAALQTIKMIRNSDTGLPITVITADQGLSTTNQVCRTCSVKSSVQVIWSHILQSSLSKSMVYP